VPMAASYGLDAFAAAHPPYGDLSLLRAASGDLWLSWREVNPSWNDAPWIVLRRHQGVWEQVEEFRSTGSAFSVSLVCADEQGTPVVAVADENGGHLLYRQR